MTDPNRLIDAYLDGTLSEDELAQLDQDLASSAEYADAFAATMMISELLGQRVEHESITKAMRLDDGSFFLGEADLQVLQDDYDHAEAQTVTLLGELPAQHTKDPGSLSAHDLAAVGGYVLRKALTSKPAKRIYAYTAAAAIVLLAAVLLNPWSGSNEPSFVDDTNEKPAESAQPILRDQAVATLTATHNAIWAQASSAPGSLTPGSKLHPNTRLTLTAGFAEITTNDGAVAILEAPATIELLDSDNAVRLLSGRLVGLCHTQNSKGFVVKTPFGSVTDLGTEFGVNVSDELFEATVFAGDIRFKPKPNAGPAHKLKANQTLTMTSAGDTHLITREHQAAAGYARRMPRPTVVDSASINLAGFEPRIVPQGVYEDAEVYTDHLHQLNGVNLDGIPPILLSGDLICMPGEARTQRTPGAEHLEVDLKLNQQSDIYLLYPESETPSEWLKEQYALTGMTVGLDLAGKPSRQHLGVGPGNSIDWAFTVWKRKQPLVGSAVVAGSMHTNMYAIIVVPLEERRMGK